MFWGLQASGRGRRRCAAALAAIAVTVSLAGCAAPESVQPLPTSTPVPSATPIFASNDEALAAAKKVYVKYLAVSDEIMHRGGDGTEKLESVLTKSELKSQQESVDLVKAQRVHTTGLNALAGFKYQRANLATGEITTYACTDHSKVRVRDIEGRDVTPEQRVDRTTSVVTFQKVGDLFLISSSLHWKGDSIC